MDRLFGQFSGVTSPTSRPPSLTIGQLPTNIPAASRSSAVMRKKTLNTTASAPQLPSVVVAKRGFPRLSRCEPNRSTKHSRGLGVGGALVILGRPSWYEVGGHCSILQFGRLGAGPT
jgi:hypothetical protein